MLTNLASTFRYATTSAFTVLIEVAQKILENIRQLKIEHKKSSAGAHLSISIGINTLIPDAYTSLSSIVEKADRCLYEAKHSGRDRYISETES